MGHASRDSGIPIILRGAPLPPCDGGVLPAPSCAYTPSVRTLLGGDANESCAGLVTSISVIVALLLTMLLLYYVLFRTANVTPKAESEDYYDHIHDRVQRTRALRARVEDRTARTIQKAWRTHAAPPTRPTAGVGRR